MPSKRAYNLYEDIKFMLHTAALDKITKTTCKEISDKGILQRTTESLWSRYFDFLKYVNNTNDFDMILTFITENQNALSG